MMMKTTNLPMRSSRRDSATSISTLADGGKVNNADLDELILRVTREVTAKVLSEKVCSEDPAIEKHAEDLAGLIAETVSSTLSRKIDQPIPFEVVKTLGAKTSAMDDTNSTSSTNSPTNSKRQQLDEWSEELVIDQSEPSLRQEKEPKSSKNVMFRSITVREYPQIIGDNPSCHDGASLTIGWDYNELPSLPVGSFEKMRYNKRRTAGSSKMVLNRQQRHLILLRLGYQESEIVDAVRKANKIRTQRRQTNNNLLGSGEVEQALSGVARRLKNILTIQK